MIDGIEWVVEPGLTSYPEAVAAMEVRADAIRSGTARERIWLVEHPPVYTAGTSADPAELLDPHRLPVFAAGRGGRHTWHGPGQRVVYLMLDLDRRGRDIRRFVAAIETWIIAVLDDLGVAAFATPGRVGVWTKTTAGEGKIAAIGVRVRRWVSFHGFALNVAPDLAYFGGIVPCGLAGYSVTSLAALGHPATMARVDEQLVRRFPYFLRRLVPLSLDVVAAAAKPLEGCSDSANVHPG